MRIAFDIDGVLIDTVRQFAKYHKLDYNKILKYDFGLPKTVVEEMFSDFHRSKEFFNLKPAEATVALLKTLSKDHTLFIITSRQTELIIYTIYWVLSNFGNVFSDIIFTSTKGAVCNNLNINLLIEDCLSNCEAADIVGTSCLIMDAPYNKSEKFNRIYHLTEMEEYIHNDKNS